MPNAERKSPRFYPGDRVQTASGATHTVQEVIITTRGAEYKINNRLLYLEDELQPAPNEQLYTTVMYNQNKPDQAPLITNGSTAEQAVQALLAALQSDQYNGYSYRYEIIPETN